MKLGIKLIIIAVIFNPLFSCKSNTNSPIDIDAVYLKKLEESRTKLNINRIPYLELCGLYKMEKPSMPFGLNSEGKLLTDATNIETFIGYFEWHRDHYDFNPVTSAKVRDEFGKNLREKHLTLDKYGNSEKLFYNNFEWRIITRSGAAYLRVWDKKNPAISAFKGFEHYKVNPNFIFVAQFDYYQKTRDLKVASKLGIDDTTTFIGKLTFSYQNTPYTLEVGEKGWLMLSDLTSGNETYGGGRYMYIDLPAESGSVILDFNHLYNPPCQYSEYTTCLFPPTQNNLPFAIQAGELSNFIN